MKILSLGVLLSLCFSCNDGEKKTQKHEDRKSSPYQEVMPEKGRR